MRFGGHKGRWAGVVWMLLVAWASMGVAWGQHRPHEGSKHEGQVSPQVPDAQADAGPGPSTLAPTKVRRKSVQVSRYARFIKKIQEQIKQTPRSARLHTILGRLYQRDGDLQKARRHYKLALGWQREYSHALVGMAHLSLRAGKPHRAGKLLKRVLRRHPRHASAWAEQSEYLRILAMRSKHKKRKEILFKRAIEAQQKAVIYRPKSHRYRYRLGILYLARRRAYHANIQFAAAHASLPIHPCYKLGLVVSESLLMRDRKTLYADLKAGALQCGHPLLSRMGGSMLVVVAMQRAQTYVGNKQLGKAVNLMKEATRLAPHISGGFFFLALLQYQNQQCNEARKTLRALLQREPNHALAKKLLQHSKALDCGPLPSRRFFRKTYDVLQRMRARQRKKPINTTKSTPRNPRHPTSQPR